MVCLALAMQLTGPKNPLVVVNGKTAVPVADVTVCEQAGEVFAAIGLSSCLDGLSLAAPMVQGRTAEKLPPSPPTIA
jgi:hypothetical protein